MLHKPHSLTGDFGREGGGKYLNIQQRQERGTAKWISGKLKGRRVSALIFFTHVVMNSIPRISASGMFYWRNIPADVMKSLID
jgi:hypothetical protein